MNKTLKLALLPAAVASAMFANSAFAGTEACFEVYKSAGNAINAHETLYTPASCVVNNGAGIALSNQLSAQNPATVAWELTKDFTLDAENVNAANETLNIVYIPTTDIPPASRIVLALDGATWAAANNNQIHLIKAEDVGGTIEYSAVASTDGNVTGTSEITFVTKAGVTIGAGTRLVLSLTNNIADDTAGDIVSPKVRIQNTGCAPQNAKVTIAAKQVTTDANQQIQGGKTDELTPFTLVDISSQFGLGVNSKDATDVEVDAEAPSYRLKFVTEKNGGNWVGKVIESEYFWETEFTNDLRLDQFVDVDGMDKVQLKFYSNSTPGSSVMYSALRTPTGTTALDESQLTHLVAGAYTIQMNDSVNSLVLGTNTSDVQTYDADEVFLKDADKLNRTKVAYKVYNDDLTNGVMNFNYQVSANFGLNLADDKHLDDNFCSSVQDVANVGVNGAVLKVPYAYDTDKNWVRITNEHTSEAEITVDVFGETSDGTGTVAKTFTLGNVAAKDSVVYRADEIIKKYKDAYVDDSSKLVKRYTFTFTVTAPKNAVHGVSVQAIPGGVDRVMPVLDQNDWAQ